MDEDQAGQDPEISRVALAGPDPEPTHDEFMAYLYPNVQESLKFSADEHAILEDPLSSTGTLSSIKNLKDAYAIGDQFINDKSTDDESRKLNVEAEVVFMVTVPIYQASSSVPLLLTPPPPQQQSTTDSKLVARVTALEQKFTAFKQKSKNLDNTTQNLRYRVFTLELRDLPHKIDEVVCENVKEAVQIALHAPLRDRFRDLPEADMKEMLHQRMFETGSYISHSMKLLRHLWNGYKGTNSLLNRISLARDDVMIKTLILLHQILIQDDRPTTPKPAWVIPTSHIPDAVNNWANALATTYQAPTENSLLDKTGDMQMFMNWYCQKMGKAELTQADLEGQAYEVVKAFYPDVVQLQIDISRLLPLSGPPGHVTIQTQFFFNNDLYYLRYGNKGNKQALSISKMKAARYHDFGLELLVPEHMWINDDCTYEISASYGWDAKGYEYKHDYTIITSPRAVVFPVSNNERKIMRFNEIYKFSDDTLTNILEALDYRVKEYKVNRLNSGMNTRFWTDKDVTRSKEFIHAIERRLKTRRIYWNLECFVGGRVRDIDYRLLQRTE
ncbi:hypothetical protein Tco_0312920 [Tanacetum coccineum]